MKTSDVLVWGGLVGLGTWVFLKARALGNLIVSPGQVVAMDFVQGVPTITFTMLAANTSGSDLVINSFAGNVYSNDTMIGNVYNFYPIAIPGNQQTPVTVNVQLRVLGIVNDLIRAFQTKQFAQGVKIEGYANVSGIQLPVKLNFSVGS